MKTNLLINGIILLAAALIVNLLRSAVGGIFDTIILVLVIILGFVGIIRIIEALISGPGRAPARVIHHVHHYRR